MKGGQQERQGLFADLVFYFAVIEFFYFVSYVVWPSIWPPLYELETSAPIVWWGYICMSVISAFGMTTAWRILILWRGSGQKRQVEDSE